MGVCRKQGRVTPKERAEESEDDDVEWYRQEVGVEPDPGWLEPLGGGIGSSDVCSLSLLLRIAAGLKGVPLWKEKATDIEFFLCSETPEKT